MLFHQIWIIVAGMLLAFLQEVITSNICVMLIILYSVHWLIFNYSDMHVVSFYSNYCSPYVIDCYKKVWLLSTVLSYIQFIYWPFTCFNLYFDSEIWIVVASMLLAVFQWFHFMIIKLLLSYIKFIDWFLSCLFCMFSVSIWIMVVGMFLGCFYQMWSL